MIQRKFINQDKLSDKFWNIEINWTSQKLIFGKIGTNGRVVLKKYTNKEECLNETNKLISQKLKKGYTELMENEAIPKKVEISADKKAEVSFWNAISKSNNAHGEEYDVDEHIENLTSFLSRKWKETLVSFEKTLREKLHQLYTAEIIELYIILENEFKNEDGVITFDDYISTDGFIYFRCWLILKWESFFNDITKDINTFLFEKYDFDISDIRAEGLLYVADDAFSINHDNEDDSIIRDAVSEAYPKIIHYDMEERLNRELLKGNRLQETYPDLVKEITELKSQ